MFPMSGWQGECWNRILSETCHRTAIRCRRIFAATIEEAQDPAIPAARGSMVVGNDRWCRQDVWRRGSDYFRRRVLIGDAGSFADPTGRRNHSRHGIGFGLPHRPAGRPSNSEEFDAAFLANFERISAAISTLAMLFLGFCARRCANGTSGILDEVGAARLRNGRWPTGICPYRRGRLREVNVHPLESATDRRSSLRYLGEGTDKHPFEISSSNTDRRGSNAWGPRRGGQERMKRCVGADPDWHR